MGLPVCSPGGRFFGEIWQWIADVVLIQQEHIGAGEDQSPGLQNSWWGRGGGGAWGRGALAGDVDL